MLESDAIAHLRAELKAEIAGECAKAKTEIYLWICGACVAATVALGLVAMAITILR